MTTFVVFALGNTHWRKPKYKLINWSKFSRMEIDTMPKRGIAGLRSNVNKNSEERTAVITMIESILSKIKDVFFMDGSIFSPASAKEIPLRFANLRTRRVRRLFPIRPPVKPKMNEPIVINRFANVSWLAIVSMTLG